MTFPDQASLKNWRKAKAEHSDHADWAGELALAKGGVDITAILKAYAPSPPEADGDLAEILVDGLTVSLWMDVPEDSFREWVGDVALALRTGALHQAKGVFYFLGLAGADGDFAYELKLAKGGSRLKELSGKAIQRVYDSDGYQGLVARAAETMEAANPGLARFLEEQRNGHRAVPVTAGLYGEIQRALAKLDGVRLHGYIADYPNTFPKGGKSMSASALFKTPESLAEALAKAETEEIRALGLWLLDRVDGGAAEVIASRVLADGTTSDVLKGAAVPILARHPTKASLAAIVSLFHGTHDVPLVLALRDTLAEVDGADLDQALLTEFHRPFDNKDRFGLLVLVDTMGKRKGLAVHLARYVCGEGDYEAQQNAAQAVLNSEVPEALAILEGFDQLSKAGLAVAKWLFERDPMLLWRRIEPRLATQKRHEDRDACIVYALQFLAQPKYKALLAKAPWNGLVAAALRLHWSVSEKAVPLVPLLAADPDIVTAFGEFLTTPDIYFMNFAPTISELKTKALLPVLQERLKNAKNPKLARGVDPKFLAKEIARLERL